MKKPLSLLLILLFIIFPVLADSESLNTEITTVSFGPHDFGFGLAPTGTNFVFYDSFKLIPTSPYKARFSTRIVFSNPNNSYFGGFNYDTGTPMWINKYVDIKDISQYFLSGYYFRPDASCNISLSQGFGTNPVSKSGPLLNITFDFNSRFSMARESLDVHRGTRKPVFYDPINNINKNPFGPDSTIKAYPWLQDSRNTLSNYVALTASISLNKGTGFRTSDGLYLSSFIEYGPSWLANNLTMNAPTSDYFKIGGSITETLTLYTKKQSNGWNWVSIQLRHSNSYNYTSGNIVPFNKLPPDRLKNYFSDSLTLEINGPQFIAWDCYTDITLGLYNSCYFGNIVNETSQTTFASEWSSNLSMRYHMRLFGFMHFKYEAGFKFYNGIHTSRPNFYQNAKVSFYISL